MVAAMAAALLLATPIPAPGPYRDTAGRLLVHNDSCFLPPATQPYPSFAPRYHLCSSCLGENDPSGAFYFRGVYHMFFELHAAGGYSAAHAISTDLVHWRELPPALWPSEWFVGAGVWDFSTTVVNGVPTMVGCGVTLNASSSHFCHFRAVPVDPTDPQLRDWRYLPSPMCYPRPGDSPSNTWRTSTGEYRYVDSYGSVYASRDFASFTRAANASAGGASSSFGVGCCGDLFLLPRVCDGCDGAFVGEGQPQPPTHVWMSWPVGTLGVYELATYDEAAPFTSGVKTAVPLGVAEANLSFPWLSRGNFLAAKSFHDPVRGRRLLSAWLTPDVQVPGPSEAPGIRFKYDVQSLMREATYDPRLRMVTTFPIDELQALREAPPLADLPPTLLRRDCNLTLVKAGAAQAEVRLRISPLPTAAVRVGLVLMTGDADGAAPAAIELFVDLPPPPTPSAKVWPAIATSDRSSWGTGGGGSRVSTFPLLRSDAALELAVFIDHTWVEWFAQAGRFSETLATPAAALSAPHARHALLLFTNATEGLTVSARAYGLRSIWHNATTHDRDAPASSPAAATLSSVASASPSTSSPLTFPSAAHTSSPPSSSPTSTTSSSSSAANSTSSAAASSASRRRLLARARFAVPRIDSTPAIPAERHAECNARGCEAVCAPPCAHKGSTARHHCAQVLSAATAMAEPTPPLPLSSPADTCVACVGCDATPPPLRTSPPAAVKRSWHFCTGSCCEPGARERTCVLGDVVYTPPDTFTYAGRGSPSRFAAFLHNRFSPGYQRFSLLEPAVQPGPFEPLPVIDEPIFLTADLHSNIGHNILDAVFPIFAASVRLREAAARAPPDDKGAAAALHAVPDLARSEANATLLLQALKSDLSASMELHLPLTDRLRMSHVNTHWHRGKEARAWAERIFGNVADRAQLAAACPRGCVLRAVVFGVGHLGGSLTDERNRMAGAQDGRALWHYRNRILRRHSVPPPLPAEAAGGRHVTFVASRRQSAKTVGNFDLWVEAVRALPGVGSAQVVEYETMPFAARLAILQRTAVLVCGVGTAQASTFLLPDGAVTVSMGWVQPQAKQGIMYFDSHFINALDHVRVLYYSSYDRNVELNAPCAKHPKMGWCKTYAVTLNVTKATALVEQALQVQAAKFEIPLPAEINLHKYDHLYYELSRRTGGESHRVRNGDDTLPFRFPNCMVNSVAEMLWSNALYNCPWRSHVGKIVQDFMV